MPSSKKTPAENGSTQSGAEWEESGDIVAIAAAIREAIRSESIIRDDAEIDVSMQRGEEFGRDELHLTGTVSTLSEKMKAEEVAVDLLVWSIRVVNRIVVRS